MNDHEILEYNPKDGPPSVVRLQTTKPDVEVAEEIKNKIKEAYQPLLAILNEMDSHGFMCQAGVGKDAFGKYQIVQLSLIKTF